MKLVIAEKPSVMRDIAAVLGAAQKTADGALCGNGYIVTSARGHLVRLKQPDEYNEGTRSGRSPTCLLCRIFSSSR